MPNAVVAVTGANGFIGRTIASRPKERGDTVTGVDLQPSTAHQVIAVM